MQPVLCENLLNATETTLNGKATWSVNTRGPAPVPLRHRRS
jgi:hypothetical protein